MSDPTVAARPFPWSVVIVAAFVLLLGGWALTGLVKNARDGSAPSSTSKLKVLGRDDEASKKREGELDARRPSSSSSASSAAASAASPSSSAPP